MDREALKAHIGRHPVEGSPEEMRRAFRQLTASVRDAAGPSQAVTIAGRHAELIGSQGGAPLLYFHGGGYVFGEPSTHRGITSVLAGAAGRDVIALDLPTAPEEPWPAQREAGREALDALYEEHEAPVEIAGDSAGGHLALLLGLLEPAKVARIAVFSPNTLRESPDTASRSACAETDAMNDHESDERLARLAFGGIDGNDPEQSLTRQDLSRLPPTRISARSEEILRDDSLLFALAAARAGARVDLSVREGFHLEELFAPRFAPGRQSVQSAGFWLAAMR